MFYERAEISLVLEVNMTVL